MLKNQKGVTLVELLIVIVILGIIAAISVPAVGNIVDNANKDAVLADATNLQQQASLYCTSNNHEDICDTEKNYYTDGDFTGEDGVTEAYFSSDENDADANSLDDYVEGIDGAEYLVWYEDGAWQVAFLDTDDDLYFAGNPAADETNRDDVVTEFDDDFPEDPTDVEFD